MEFVEWHSQGHNVGLGDHTGRPNGSFSGNLSYTQPENRRSRDILAPPERRAAGS